VTTSGLTAVVQAPSSREYCRDSTPEVASKPENVNTADVELSTGCGGPPSTIAVGATVSTVQVWVGLAAPMFPATSIARTAKVWTPWARFVSVTGLAAVVQVAPPSLVYWS
jgi:hypothetical protein